MSINKIDLLLKDVQSDLESITETLIKASRIVAEDPASSRHAEVIDQLKTKLQECKKTLTEELKYTEKYYTILNYLKDLLRHEYEGLFDYRLHAQHIEDEELAKDFNDFFTDEVSHAQMLIDEIRKLGGTPKIFVNNPTPKGKFTLREILELHEKGEKEAIQLLEEAKRNVNNPEYNDFFDKIITDEKRHLILLKELSDKYRDSDLFIRI